MDSRWPLLGVVFTSLLLFGCLQQTVAPGPTPTPLVSPTLQITPAPTATVTATPTPSPTPSPSPTATPVPTAVASASPRPSATGTFAGRYVVAFHVRDISGGINVASNKNQLIYLAYSDDGASWTPVPGFKPFSGSAPDVVRRGDTVYIYTPDPDKVTRYNAATGVLDAGTSVTIRKSDGTTDHYGDVTPYLDPSTDKIVLFYKSTLGFNGDPQLCDSCPERSATEVDGGDGSQFVMDSGDRISSGKISDVDVFNDGQRYYLYLGSNPTRPGETAKVTVYTSQTLKGSYSILSTLPNGVLTSSGSVPQGYYDAATEMYWTYITVLRPNQPAIIKRAIHKDFSRQLTDADFTTVISNSYPGLKSTDSPESPGFAVNG